jgi:hypothetical protein
MTGLNRWRFVAHGEIGYVWHDTLYNRYVLSDALGPEGVVVCKKRGATRPDPKLFQTEAAGHELDQETAGTDTAS